MENYQRREDHLFNLTINDTAKAYMLETGRWTKFLGIVGLIFCGLFLLFAIFFLMGGSAWQEAIGTMPGMEGLGVMMFMVQIFSIFLVAYPSIQLIRYANNIGPALETANDEQFNLSFKSLKNTFKFYGIIMIVALGFYALVFVFAILGGVIAGMAS